MRFIGLDAYKAAGGRLRLDLFSDEPEGAGYILDVPLLDQLVIQKMGEHEARYRAEACGEFPGRRRL